MLRQRETYRDDTPKARDTNSSRVKRLLHWDELEEWQKDNEFIHTGYVKSEKSFKAVIASLAYVHNETGNIYTHLLPSVTICLLLGVLFVTSVVTPAFVMFFLGAMTCLGMSATFHSLKSHSHRISIIGNKLDYLGICILIAASMIALIDFAFDDMFMHHLVFNSITATLCVACSIVSLMEKFRSREYRPTRAIMFICYGLSGVLPIVVGVLELGYAETSKRAACPWLYAEAFFYILGASLYALRIPEKFNPGKYDLIGHSHQIFHVFVVIAAWCHYMALIRAQEYSLHRQLLRNLTG